MSTEVFLPTITFIIKFSVDTAILAILIKNCDPSDYFLEIKRVVKWCEDNHLVLNVNKIEKMESDPRADGDHKPVVIHNQTTGPLL